MLVCINDQSQRKCTSDKHDLSLIRFPGLPQQIQLRAIWILDYNLVNVRGEVALHLP